MAIPQQVQKDIDDLAVYEKQLADEAAARTAAETAPPVEPPVVPETPVVAETPPVPPVNEPPKLSEWEHKYRTLEGKYNAEVPRLHAELRDLKSQVADLVKMKSTQTPPAPAPAPSTPVKLVTAKDVEDYGQDLIDVQRRVVREELAPLQDELSKRDAKIALLEQAQTKTTSDVTTLTFEQRLALQVPDFDTVNADPKWIAFLDELDPYTNEPRRTYAEFVYNNGDVAKLKNIVDFFKASTTPAVTPQPSAADAERQKRQIELERQVSPTRANAPVSTTPTENERIYTEAEADRLFKRVRDLNIAKKFEEATKLETELSAAYMEGRVRG